MRIALCDFDQESMKKTKAAIYHYANRNRLDLIIDEYRSGKTLLSSGVSYSMVFLEYLTGSLNGLETAKILRRNSKCAIVFLTGRTDFILDSFQVSPFRFLVKPSSNQQIFTVMNDYFRDFGYNHPILIKSTEDYIQADTSDIFYIEANNKHCIVHLKNEGIPCTQTMAKVYETLPKSHFCKINRAYIVNTEHVWKYNNDRLILTNKEKLHITRNYLKSFKEDCRQAFHPHVI